MQTKNRVVKGSKVPSINLSKEILSLLIRLEDSESKEILVGIRDYVYKDKEPSVSEDVEDIMEMVLDNVNYIASKHINGKKGGKPKKNNSDISINTEFENTANKALNPQDDINIPQEEIDTPERLKMPLNEEFENNITEPQITEESMGNYTGIQLKINNTPQPRKEEVVEYRSQNRIPTEKTIPTENTIMEALNKLNAKLPFMKDRIYNTTTKGLDFESNLNRIIESVDKIVGEYIQDKEIRLGIYTHIINKKIKYE